MFILFSRDDCPWCDKAKALLNELGHTFHTVKLTPTGEGKGEVKVDAFKAMYPELKTVPQIWHRSTHVGGFEDLEKYLNKVWPGK